jgi:hypothetical protein
MPRYSVEVGRFIFFLSDLTIFLAAANVAQASILPRFAKTRRGAEDSPPIERRRQAENFLDLVHIKCFQVISV